MTTRFSNPASEATGEAKIELNPESLDPVLLKLGLLIGILKKDESHTVFNTDWLKDPIASIKQIPTARRQELLDVLQTLLGSKSGSALGTPQVAVNRLWYPIRYPGDKPEEAEKPTGLYVVTNQPEKQEDPQQEATAAQESEAVIIGLGILYPVKQEFINITPYAYFPLFELSESGAQFGFGNNSAELGIEIAAPKGEPFGAGDVSFTGFKASCNIYFSNQPPRLDFVLLNLKLPGQDPANRSLDDLITKTSVEQWLASGISVLAGLLAGAAKDESTRKQVAAITTRALELLGLTGNLPAIDWRELTKEPSKAEAIFLQWVQQIVGSSSTLTTFLNDIYSLRHGVAPVAEKAAENVTGQGTRSDPFAIDLIKVEKVATLSLTMSTEFDAQNRLHVYPGLRIDSALFKPVASIGVRIAASVEMADILLESTVRGQMPLNAAAGSSLFPSFSVMAVLANPAAGEPLLKIGSEAEKNHLSVDKAMLGAAYSTVDATSGTKTLIPTLRLSGVNSTYGAWDWVDLANYDQTIQLLSEGLAVYLSDKLRKFLSETGGTVAANLAAVLGITPPPGYKEAWPLAGQMLLSADKLELLVKDPLAALASYYARCLEAVDDEGKPAWKHLLSSFAGLVGGEGGTVTGAGTDTDPWRVQLARIGSNGPIAYLEASQSPAAETDQKVLSFAIQLGADLHVEKAVVTMAARLGLMTIKLPRPNGSGAMAAQWLAGLEARLLLTGAEGPLMTPPTAGMSMQAEHGLLSAGWDPDQGFHWRAAIEQLAIKYSSGDPKPIGSGRLEFSSTSTKWDSSVITQLAPVILNILGMALLSNGGRPGLALTCALGLMPGLPEVINGSPDEDSPFEIPKDVSLPKDWPSFSITDPAHFFANPWNDLRKQIATLFAPQSKFAMPMLRVLGWAITGNVPPDAKAMGNSDDPWAVLLQWELPSKKKVKIEALAWAGEKKVGFGLGFPLSQAEVSGVKLDASIRAGLAYLNLNGEQGDDPALPRLTLSCLLSGDPLLVGASGEDLQIAKARLGAYADRSGVFPVVTIIDAKLGKDKQYPVVKLASVPGKPVFASNVEQQVMEALLNAAMDRLSQALQESSEASALLSALDLLADLGLAQVRFAEGQPDKKSYGVNVGSWDALLANPPAFLSAQMNALLADDQKSDSLIKNLARLTGLKLELPKPLEGLPDFLSVFGLMLRTGGGHMIQLSSWIRLASNPVAYLNERLKYLLGDEAARQSLVSQFSTWTPPEPPLSKVRFSVTSGVRFALEVAPSDPIDVGSAFKITGAVTLDLQARTFKASALLHSDTIGSGLSFDYSFDSAGQGAWRLALTGAPGPLPDAFAPLQLYPLPQNDLPQYFAQLGLRIPLFIVSTVTGEIINRYVLPRYPLATNLLEGLRLAERSAPDKPYRVKWLLRAFLHPIDWTFSPEVLGDGKGGIDLKRFGEFLCALPGPDGIVGPGDILLKRVEEGEAKGLALTKLPYGAEFKVASAAEEGVALSVSAQPKKEVDIGAGMAFGTGNGVAVFGKANLHLAFGSTDDKKELHILSSFEGGRFNVSLTGKSGSFDLPEITLVPFQGLSHYIPDAGQTAKLLDFVAGQSLEAYNKYKQGSKPDPNVTKFVDAVIEFAGFFGVANASDLMKAFDAIKQNPVKWLTEWFAPEKVGPSLEHLNNLLSKTFGLKGFSIVDQADQTLLQFAPDIDADTGSIKIKLGNRDHSGHRVFGVWVEPELKKLFLLAHAEAGVGVRTPVNTAAPVFDLLLNGSLSADVKSFAGLGLPFEPCANLSVGFDTERGIQNSSLVVYPVRPKPEPEPLAIILLPTPSLAYGNPPAPAQDAARWMGDFAVQFIAQLVGDMALQNKHVGAWMKMKVGGSEVTPGAVLSKWGLLEATGEREEVRYLLRDLKTAFSGLTFKQVIEKLIYTTLSLFPEEFKLISQKNIDLFIASKSSGQAKDFGLGLRLKDFKVAGGADKNGGKSSRTSPQLLLQVGKWMTGDTDDDSWFARGGGDKKIKPGLKLYLVSFEQTTPSFNAQLEIISMGVDLKGVNQKPLLDVKGVTLGGVEPRLYFSIKMNEPSKFQLGGGLRLDDLGIPLGPGFADKTDGKNPVAQNLLASRNSAENKEPVNPTFSAAASYVNELSLQFYEGIEKADKLWIPVQRAFGPIQCRKVGVGWKGSPKYLFSVMFDGKVSLAALNIDLMDLSVGLPVTDLKSFDSYELELAGLNVTFANGPVLISGGLLKTENPLAYTGQVIIKAQKFMVAGLGSYAVMGGSPSMFAFAFLSMPLGGVPEFFVTGLAAGFGFNRGLKLPGVEEVHKFPLVAGLATPSIFGNGSPEAGLTALADWVKPELGSYWLAAGLKFTTYELLETTAVMFIKFGKEFELSLLGMATFKLPKDASAKPYVRVELALEVSIKTSEGVVRVAALLTPNSYLIDEKCRLTGGFSFNLWFAPSLNAGDFVLSIGGYHPAFDKPKHYPEVPRVGFRWLASSEVVIQGGAYFALTPSCVMAGGALEISYESGRIRAWFKAHANFLMAWKPFFYSIDIGVSIGVSYEVDLLLVKSISAELSVSVEIWGPRMRGKARVSWYIISFTVWFGEGSDQRNQGGVIEWKDFSESFLPKPDAGKLTSGAPSEVVGEPPPPPTTQNVVSVTCPQGIIQIQKDDPKSGEVKKGAPWVVRAAGFKLATRTAIPATEIEVDMGKDKPKKSVRTGPAVGLRPVGSMTLKSTHTISAQYLKKGSPLYLNLSEDWDWEFSTNGVPASLWDTKNPPKINASADVLKDRLTGIAGLGPKPRPVSGPPRILADYLGRISLMQRTLPLSPKPRSQDEAEAITGGEDSFKVIENTVMSGAVKSYRDEIIDAAIDLGIAAEDGRLDILAAAVGSLMDAPPLLGSLGQPVAGGRLAQAGVVRLKSAARFARPTPVQSSAAEQPRLVAIMRQYGRQDSRMLAARSSFSLAPASVVTGKVHSFRSLSRAEDTMCLKAAASSLPGEDAKPRGMNLHPGATLLWDLPEKVEGGHRLHFDGSFPVRIAAFDSNYEWLCDQEVAHSGPEDFEVPAGAARLALTGLSEERGPARARAIGWHSDSLMIQVNPHASLGEGVIVRTCAPRGVRQGPSLLDHGLSYARDVVASNLLRSEEGSAQAGWIETVVPVAARTVTVVVEREDGQPVESSQVADVVEVSIPLAAPDGEGGRNVLLPDHVMVEGAQANLFYSIPAEGSGAINGLVSVLVRTQPGWRQEGFAATQDEPRSALSRWEDVAVEQSAVLQVAGSGLKSEVQFID